MQEKFYLCSRQSELEKPMKQLYPKMSLKVPLHHSGRIFIVVLLPVIVSCLCIFLSCGPRRYHIGVSQCSNDGWRIKANREIRIGQYQYNNVDVSIVSADNNSQRQVEQIDSMVANGIDLLVVSPSDAQIVSPAIDRAFNKGIPVILYDRMSRSKKYTAFIGADNVAIGRTMAQYVASIASDGSEVVEITGLKGSTPVDERHRGFMEGIRKSDKHIKVTTLKGDWTIKTPRRLMRQLLKEGHRPVCVFCHNDGEAYGAYLGARDLGMEKNIKFVGIDGLPGPNQGVEWVRDGMLTASYIYPTKGERIIPLAMRILQHQPFKRINILSSALVTEENAAIVDMQNNEMLNQMANLSLLYNDIDRYISLNQSQRIILIMTFLVVILLIVIAVYQIYLRKTKEQMNRKILQLDKEKIDFFTKASHQLRTPLTLVAGPIDQLLESSTLKGEDRTMVEMMGRNIHQLSALIDGVLTFDKDRENIKNASTTTPQNTALKEEKKNTSPTTLADDLINKDESREQILIIDDNDDIRYYLRGILEKQYNVLEAKNGKEGVSMTQKYIPDLVICDIMMPVMNGLEYCKIIKQTSSTCHIPVILLTARSQEAQRIEGFDHGADEYMTKPFSAEVLLARVSNLLHNHKRLKEIFDDNSEWVKAVKDIKGTDKQFVELLRKSVLDNLGDPKLKMTKVAEIMNISYMQLYRKTKALIGITPNELLRKARLKRALRLLQTTNLTIAEIAFQTGFTSPSYLSVCFKDEFGKSPTDVRNAATQTETM